MLNAYLQGKDLYSIIASSMYNNKYEDNLEFFPEGTEIEFEGEKVICGYKTHLNKEGKARRFEAKAVLLGLLYGRGPASMAEQINDNRKDPKNVCTIKDAQDIIDKFFKAYPKVEKWINDTRDFARKNGYVEDWYGRRRRLPDINLPKFSIKQTRNRQKEAFNPILGGSDKEDTVLIEKYKQLLERAKSKKDVDDISKRAHFEGIDIKNNNGFIAQAERQSVNARVQGGAATLTKMAMINIANDPILKELGFRLLVTVHDEVLGECPSENAQKAADRLSEVMIETAKPFINVPMKCDAYVVKSWYEDEWINSIENEFKNLCEGNPEKGISPVSQEEALLLMLEEHTEEPEEIILKILKNSMDKSIVDTSDDDPIYEDSMKDDDDEDEDSEEENQDDDEQ